MNIREKEVAGGVRFGGFTSSEVLRKPTQLALAAPIPPQGVSNLVLVQARVVVPFNQNDGMACSAHVRGEADGFVQTAKFLVKKPSFSASEIFSAPLGAV